MWTRCKCKSSFIEKEGYSCYLCQKEAFEKNISLEQAAKNRIEENTNN